MPLHHLSQVIQGCHARKRVRVFVSIVGHALLGSGPVFCLEFYRPHLPLDWRLFFRCESECGNVEHIFIEYLFLILELVLFLLGVRDHFALAASGLLYGGARGQILVWVTYCTSVVLATFVGFFISNGSSSFSYNGGHITRCPLSSEYSITARASPRRTKSLLIHNDSRGDGDEARCATNAGCRPSSNLRFPPVCV